MHPAGAQAGVLDSSRPADKSETIFDDPSLSETRMLQSPDTADPSRLAYRTGPLKQPLRVVGRPVVDLWASSDTTSTHYAVELVDVDPTGAWSIVHRGFGNPRYRSGLEGAIDLVPGQPYHFQVPILDNDYTFAAGHSIGLLVSGSNAVWALPDMQNRANNTILHSGDHASALILQVVSAAEFGVRPPAVTSGGGGLPTTSVTTLPRIPLALVLPLAVLLLALAGVSARRRGRG
jgi:X-Pro dipeptidyl-peptidase